MPASTHQEQNEPERSTYMDQPLVGIQMLSHNSRPVYFAFAEQANHDLIKSPDFYCREEVDDWFAKHHHSCNR